MKAYSKRGSAVQDAPEEMYASTTPWASSSYTVPEPAPAGALQRASAGGFAEPEEAVEEWSYVPVRGKWTFRLRRLLRTVLGRALLGSAALILLVTAGVAAYLLQSFLLHDPRFVIPSSTHIETLGSTHLTRSQMLSVFGEDVERNIFKVPLAQRKADLERLPWVQRATVMRLLPNTLRVSVVERTPVAFVRQGGSIGLVDGSGALLDMPANAAGDPAYSFPVLTGISSGDAPAVRAARIEIYDRFMKELDSSGEKVTESISEVDISNPEDVKAVIATGNLDVLVHFGDQNFLEEYRHFHDHLGEWRQQYPKLVSADMRYDRQVVLDTGAGVTPPAPAATAARQAVATPAVKAIPKPGAATAVVAPAHVPHAAPVKQAGSGTSAANAKMFAALAAARKQQTQSSGQEPR